MTSIEPGPFATKSVHDWQVPQGVGVGPFSQLSERAMILALEVLPHPRGPLNRYAWWIDPEAKAFDSGTVTCSCPITSAKVEGRYFLYRASDTVLLLIRDPPCTRQSAPTLATFRSWGSSVR